MRNKHILRIVCLMLALVMLCTLLGGCGAVTYDKSRCKVQYKDADELYKAGEYYKAAKIFVSLMGTEVKTGEIVFYKDSLERAHDCYYEDGKRLMAEGEFSVAKSRFEDAGDYKDSQELFTTCATQHGYESLLARLADQGFSDLDVTVDSSEFYISNEVLWRVKIACSSDAFADLEDDVKMQVLQMFPGKSLTSRGSEYKYEKSYLYHNVYKDGEVIYEVYEEPPKPSSPGACPNCKGSGLVKFYYGSSDLEAWLDGYDPYTVGTCPTCEGTGKNY
jgi:hypothetical protein